MWIELSVTAEHLSEWGMSREELKPGLEVWAYRLEFGQKRLLTRVVVDLPAEEGFVMLAHPGEVRLALRPPEEIARPWSLDKIMKKKVAAKGRRLGLCARCREKKRMPNRQLCESCAKILASSKLKDSEEYEGLCTRCYRRERAEGKRSCARCLEYARNYQRAYGK